MAKVRCDAPQANTMNVLTTVVLIARVDIVIVLKVCVVLLVTVVDGVGKLTVEILRPRQEQAR